jgi:aryl-alcohol dehydrogenase-like predicted oxidoreductase
MEPRTIGSLSVSVVGLGCNQLGTSACDEATSSKVVADALEAGITFFDTSDEYGRSYADPSDLSGWGRSEELLGRALAGHRDDVVIATKFGPVGHIGPGGEALFAWERSEASARGVRIAAEESLQRLGTDHIDLYQLHFPDPRFPIEETLGVLDELVAAGKVREIGCSNFTGAELRAAVMPACDELKVAFVPYYPLASGVLTGKYRRSDPEPAGARLTEQVDDATRERILSDRAFTRLEALERYAKDHGRSLLELAFAWLLGQPSVATVIAGASRPGQPAANARAAGWRLSPDEVGEITRLVAES